MQLVRRGVVRQPQSRRPLVTLTHHLLFLLLKHDDLLLSLLRGGRAGNGGPSLWVEGLALEHLGLAFGAWLRDEFLQTTRDAGLLLVSFVGRADLGGAFGRASRIIISIVT